jgi:futalosine hydrolase
MRLREKLRALQIDQAPRVLVVTAVEAERAAILRGLGEPEGESARDNGEPVVVLAGGVGPATVAATTAGALTRAEALGRPFAVAMSAGIAGGFVDRAPLGATVLATRSVAADLGAESPDGFLSVDDLGFGSAVHSADPDVLTALREQLPAALVGEVLTVSTVTGTAARADDLRQRHPHALAEAMEGFGVASAAAQAGIAFAELRTVSNPIGPRDRAAWRIEDALAALAVAGGTLASLVT